jgi:hypothetical protein
MKKNSKTILVLLLVLCVVVFLISQPGLLRMLNLIPGPEGVDCTLYSAVANGGIKVNDGPVTTLTDGVGIHRILGTVNPNDWIAYKDYDYVDIFRTHYPQRIGYQWERPSVKTPVIKGLIVDRNTGDVVAGVNLQVRISQPSMSDVNIHGDPTGRNPTQIDWYSFQKDKTQSEDTITWKHYECYVVPVDFVIELTIRPLGDKWVGDFQSFDLWLVLDTVAWLNAFSADQTALLKEQAPNATITSYDFRGAFPIWAWVGAWDPWVVSGRDGNPDKFYDPADLAPEEIGELQTHLQVQPSFGGSPIELYTSPGYIYTRLFAEDIIKNPDLLKQMIASSIPGLPDPRFAQTVYFPLTLINFGALKRTGGIWITAWDKEYYPTAYMRVRALYAVYGEWIYLWTQEEADKYGYKWENNTSIITGSQSMWDKFFGGLGSWFANNQMWVLLIIIVIVVIVVSIASPGVWTVLASRKKR